MTDKRVEIKVMLTLNAKSALKSEPCVVVMSV